MKPLSHRQKSVLCQAARRAYDRLCAKGEISGISFDDFRRDDCERVTGKHGLTACRNSDYNPLLAHWESLAGEDGRAMNALVREQTESRRQAEVVLLDVLNKAGLPLTYAETISQGKFRCAVLETDARQLWQLVYTVNARTAAKHRATHPPA